MVHTIGPMVYGAQTKRKGLQIATVHVLGSVFGGATTGFFAGVIGYGLKSLTRSSVGGTAVLAVAIAASLVAFVREMGTARGGFGFRRQTPRSWRYLLPDAWTAFLNGFDLGLGWTTRMYFASFPIALAAALLIANPPIGAAIGAIYGGARGGTVVGISQVAGWQPTVTERMLRLVEGVRLGNALVIGLFSVLLLASAVISGLSPWR